MQEIPITISRNDVGQIIDGLAVLVEQWEATEQYQSTGVFAPEACIREASDANEAASIASNYRQLIDKLQQQIPTRA